jgi:hypothetical protein
VTQHPELVPLAKFAASLKKQPDLQEFLRGHPEIARSLRDHPATADLIRKFGVELPDLAEFSYPPTSLGDIKPLTEYKEEATSEVAAPREALPAENLSKIEDAQFAPEALDESPPHN